MRTDGAAVVRWQGELLWPDELPEGAVVDLSAVTALGAWTYDWFRARGQTAVVAAPPMIKRQLQAAGLPILWYASRAAVDTRRDGGVSPSEREMLWS